jgi:regulatory protein
MSDEQPLKSGTDTLAGAMRLLATREHSQHELRRKLGQKGHDPDAIEAVIEQLAVQGLQSDERFIESFVTSHRERGKGPKRIRMELQQHHLPYELIEKHINERNSEWREHALQVKLKKFGQAPIEDIQDRAKQTRFLEYRGFTHDQISAVLGEE